MKPCRIHSLGLITRFQLTSESISTQADRSHQNDEAGLSRKCSLRKSNKLLLRKGIFFRTLEINHRVEAISEESWR